MRWCAICILLLKTDTPKRIGERKFASCRSRHVIVDQDSSRASLESQFPTRLYRLPRARREKDGRESSGVERIVPRRGTHRSRWADTTRWTRRRDAARQRSPLSASSLRSRPRHVNDGRRARYRGILSANIFSGNTCPGCYGRAQNGRRRERSTVRERERAREPPRLSLSLHLSISLSFASSYVLVRPMHTDAYVCTRTSAHEIFPPLPHFIIHRFRIDSRIIFHR